jgi:hypothetical protein
MACFTSDGKPKLLRCGQWACKRCRHTLAREWASIVRYGMTELMQHGGTPLFWTFTLGTRYTDAADAYKHLKRLWDNIRKSIQREQGVFHYVAFIEGQPKRKNMPHWHVVTFATVPRKWRRRKNPRMWIKDFAAHYGLGHQAVEIMITTDAAAAYVSKYVSKATLGIPKYFRRVRSSEAWPEKPEPPTKPYLVRGGKETLDAYLLRVEQASGRDIDDLLTDYQHQNVLLEVARLENE